MGEQSYLQVEQLKEIMGVWTLTALTFLLTLEDARLSQEPRGLLMEGDLSH